MCAGYMKIPPDIAADMIVENRILRRIIAGSMRGPAKKIHVQFHMALVYLSNIMTTHQCHQTKDTTPNHFQNDPC